MKMIADVMTVILFLAFTFAMSSAIRLSVCNVRAPYSGD